MKKKYISPHHIERLEPKLAIKGLIYHTLGLSSNTTKRAVLVSYFRPFI